MSTNLMVCRIKYHLRTIRTTIHHEYLENRLPQAIT